MRVLDFKGLKCPIPVLKAFKIVKKEKEINKIKQIDKLNFICLKNCGHLPHVDLPSLSSKIIYDYFCA